MLKEGKEKTYETTSNGESIYREPGTGQLYYEDQYGQLHPYNNAAPAESYSSSGLGDNRFLKLYALALFALSSGAGLWLKINLPGALYRLLTVAVPALFLLLPYWKPLRARYKLRKVINFLFAFSVYLALTPVVDSFTGGSEWAVSILGLFVNACAGAALAYVALKIATFVQNLLLAGKDVSGQPQSAAVPPAGFTPSWELDRYPGQILWRSRVNDTAIAHVAFSEDPAGITQPDRLYPTVCHRYEEENGRYMEVCFPVHEINSVDVNTKVTDGGVERIPVIFHRYNGDTLGIYFTEREFDEFFNVFNPIRTGNMG